MKVQFGTVPPSNPSVPSSKVKMGKMFKTVCTIFKALNYTSNIEAVPPTVEELERSKSSLSKKNKRPPSGGSADEAPTLLRRERTMNGVAWGGPKMESDINFNMNGSRSVEELSAGKKGKDKGFEIVKENFSKKERLRERRNRSRGGGGDGFSDEDIGGSDGGGLRMRSSVADKMNQPVDQPSLVAEKANHGNVCRPVPRQVVRIINGVNPTIQTQVLLNTKTTQEWEDLVKDLGMAVKLSRKAQTWMETLTGRPLQSYSQLRSELEAGNQAFYIYAEKSELNNLDSPAAPPATGGGLKGGHGGPTNGGLLGGAGGDFGGPTRGRKPINNRLSPSPIRNSPSPNMHKSGPRGRSNPYLNKREDSFGSIDDLGGGMRRQDSYSSLDIPPPPRSRMNMKSPSKVSQPPNMNLNGMMNGNISDDPYGMNNGFGGRNSNNNNRSSDLENDMSEYLRPPTNMSMGNGRESPGRRKPGPQSKFGGSYENRKMASSRIEESIGGGRQNSALDLPGRRDPFGPLPSGRMDSPPPLSSDRESDRRFKSASKNSMLKSVLKPTTSYSFVQDEEEDSMRESSMLKKPVRRRRHKSERRKSSATASNVKGISFQARSPSPLA